MGKEESEQTRCRFGKAGREVSEVQTTHQRFVDVLFKMLERNGYDIGISNEQEARDGSFLGVTNVPLTVLLH